MSMELSGWVEDLLARQSRLLTPEGVTIKERLIGNGEFALVAQDLLTFGIEHGSLSPEDIKTGLGFARRGAFGRVASPWLEDRLRHLLPISA